MQKTGLLIRAVLVILFLIFIVMIWRFSSQNAEVSHLTSVVIADYIQKIIAENFVISSQDYFWRYNLEEIVRKVAHFIEYLLLGSTVCAMINVIFRRTWLAMLVSLVVCPIYAYIDEYRQIFIDGRSSSWLDWKIDIAGVIAGVLLVTIFCILLRYIQFLKTKIKILENNINSLN